MKRLQPYKCETEPKAKRRCSSHIPKSAPSAKKRKVADDDKDCEVVGVHRPTAPRYEWLDYRYYPVDEAWQRQACELLGIRFVRPFQRQDGGSDMILTRPDMRSLRSIGGDGNCLFRALCYTNFRFRSSTWRITKRNCSTYADLYPS